MDFWRIVGDGQAHPGHPRRVRHRQVVARGQRGLGRHLDLPAHVHAEGAIENAVDRHLAHGLDGLGDPGHVLVVDGEHRDVPHHAVLSDVDHVEPEDVAPRLADCRRQAAERSRRVLERDANRHGIRHVGYPHGPRRYSPARRAANDGLVGIPVTPP